ncbi:hypothetical protein BLNAU_7363 [Blattamonas nauphoetae]|uniref:Ankyrin repeat protein n=1 Tax=Blattamonas nauphoetae TaxID=2049346 RepID=A0ABQ9Y1T9_9EUKA|nr:hypothetical protein BLNAU_7363 [Blattamonas nauphoetae]
MWLQRMTPEAISSQMSRYSSDNVISSLLEHLLRRNIALFNQRFDEAFLEQFSIVKELMNQTFEWATSLWMFLLTDLRKLGTIADHIRSTKNLPAQHQIDIARFLATNAFAHFSRGDKDKPVGSTRRRALLHIVNTTFHICSKINNIEIFRNLIKATENTGFPPIKDFPLDRQITYYYYRGRFALFNGDLIKAEKDLRFAFQSIGCVTENNGVGHKNTRLILLSLIPVSILHFRLPSEQLLQKHSLFWFKDIRRCLIIGDVLGMMRAIDAHRDFFIHIGDSTIDQCEQPFIFVQMEVIVKSLTTCERPPPKTVRGKHNTLLIRAALEQDLVECENLIANFQADINETGANDMNCLHVACEKRDMAMIKFFLERGIDVNAREMEESGGNTPLLITVKQGNLDACRLLLNNGANLDIADANGATPLHIAAMKGDVEMVKSLLEFGANVERVDAGGKTAWYWASSLHHDEIKELLPEQKYNWLKYQESIMPPMPKPKEDPKKGKKGKKGKK